MRDLKIETRNSLNSDATIIYLELMIPNIELVPYLTNGGIFLDKVKTVLAEEIERYSRSKNKNDSIS